MDRSIIEISSDEEDSPITSKKLKLTINENSPLKESNDEKNEVNGTSEINKNGNESDPTEIFDRFINLCKSIDISVMHKKWIKRKIPVLRKAYENASAYAQSEEFLLNLNDAFEYVSNKPISTIRNIYQELNNNSEKNQKKLKDLNELLTKLIDKINELGLVEVDFNEGENSSYMQLQEYKKRAVLTYEKIMKLTNGNPKYDDLHYNRLDYAKSSHKIINATLNKFYRDKIKRPFPAYDEVDYCVRKCVRKYNLGLSESEIGAEVKMNLEGLGEIVQKRRKTDLANVHLSYLPNLNLVPDPADTDDNLKKILDSNRRIGEDKMRKEMDRYIKLENDMKKERSN